MDDPQRTGAAHEERGGGGASSPAGLVLLYAAEHARMFPAYVFGDEDVVLGRDETCGIVVPDVAVSRRHARFERTADGWSVVNLGSRNGVLVNGVRIASSRLDHACIVRTGDALFKFVERGADQYVPYALDGMVRGAPHDGVDELVGGAATRRVAREIARVAPTNLSCLVFGETGTGKELVARALHRFSGRPGALQAINCAAVPASLFESELFGYKRGAFSGADRDKPGLVHGAHGGTLFLDEIGDMPLEVQAKLLRLLESGELLPLGATRAERVDVRTVCATHHDLAARVRDGQFRGDLFARLAEHTIELPPLRARKEDLYPLTVSFLQKHGLAPHVPFDVMTALVAYDWPFNVRELESSVRRAVALSEGAGLTRANMPAVVLAASQASSVERRENFPSAAPPPPPPPPEQEHDDPFHRGAPKEALLRKLLAEHAGNLAGVARALGKHRTQVQRYIERYGIDLTMYR